MFLNRLSAIIDFLFGARRRRALCPVPVKMRRRCLVVGVALLISSQAVEAALNQSGDVIPFDNPFSAPFEGLPNNGNTWDTSFPLGAQPRWEGIQNVANGTNINTDVFVGRTSSGTLQISQVILNQMNLVIGDSVTANNVTQVGDGVVEITGNNAIYNNDPNRVLPFLPPGFASVNPRTAEAGGQYINSSATPLPPTTPAPISVVSDGLDGYAKGFDLYVGRGGNGTLRITSFGRAEIADAVLIGDSVGATGNVIVDGFNSYLGNGGAFDYGPTSSTEFHMTIVGRLGTGNLTISNGATMASAVFASGGAQQGVVGVSLGSVPYTTSIGGPSGLTPAGGTGTATITGNGSRWTIAGSMQIGGFNNGSTGDPLSTSGDLEGDDVVYGSQSGRGNLYVNGGGLVQINNAAGVTASNNTTPLIMAIGRFGVVELGGNQGVTSAGTSGGGTIQIGSPIGGQQNQGTPNTVQLVNDGLITGPGRINTGVFRNRFLGRVKVNAAQSLVIDSSADFASSTDPLQPPPVEPLTNYGTIEVLGTSQAQAQLEFMRSPTESTTTTSVRPFVNLPVAATDTTPPTPPAFTGGLISAQYANLRFGSGLQNQSMVAFTAGTNNISGRVVNLALDTVDSGDDGDAGDSTQMLVSGPGTTAVFADDLAFGSGSHLNLVDGGKVVILNQHSLVLSGDLSINLSYTHPSLITVAGDVGIGQGTTDLSLNLASDALHSLKHGDAFQLIAFGGDIGNVNAANPLDPIPDLTGTPVFSDIDVSPDVFALYGLRAQVQFSNEGVYAVFLDPTMVGPGGGGAIAPDFNGDGVVDLADYNIWKSHVGLNSGASVLDGDADGDGDVDGADFLKWQRNVGKAPPWNGAGSGSGSGSALASVPEPTSLMLLACGGSLALAFGRRRRER